MRRSISCMLIGFTQPDSVNFPFFRGEDGRGIAGGTGYPAEWNGETGANIKWKISISPGVRQEFPGHLGSDNLLPAYRG